MEAFFPLKLTPNETGSKTENYRVVFPEGVHIHLKLYNVQIKEFFLLLTPLEYLVLLTF